MPSMIVNDLYPDLRLVCQTRTDPDPAEWDAMVAAIAQMPKVSLSRVFVISDGGTPNMKQRKALDAALLAHGSKTRTAMVTSSSVLRAVMNAIGWATKIELKCFGPEELEEAFRFMHLSTTETERVNAAIESTTRSLGITLFDKTKPKQAAS